MKAVNLGEDLTLHIHTHIHTHANIYTHTHVLTLKLPKCADKFRIRDAFENWSFSPF